MRQVPGFVTLQRRLRGAAWPVVVAAVASAALTAAAINLLSSSYWSQVGQVLGAG